MNRVFRCFTEKRTGFDVEAQSLAHDLRDNLGIRGMTGLRLINRYDVEGITPDVYQDARVIVFSEPQVDDCYDEVLPDIKGEHWVIAVEALPGQYDQRADSCAQCIQILTCGDRPAVKAARIYLFMGALTEDEKRRLLAYLINPVESRQAALIKPETLAGTYPQPEPVPTINGFTEASEGRLRDILDEYGLAMDLDDLMFMQAYFRSEEKRDPTKRN
jgi:phosphoribosylformylglycinamidine synthase